MIETNGYENSNKDRTDALLTMLEEQADEIDSLTEENQKLKLLASEGLEWKRKASNLSSEIAWIKKEVKEKEEWRQEEKEKMESDLKMMRRLASDRGRRIQELEEQVKVTKDRNSVYRVWMVFLLFETATITYFATALMKLPIPLWVIHAGVVGGWFGIRIIMRSNISCDR